jgi:hypothetical protein
MADITFTFADVRLAEPHMVSRITLPAGATIRAGQPCYIDSAGVAQLCISTVNLGSAFDGFPLASVLAGEPVTLVQQGAKIYIGAHGLDIGAFIYTSDTAGAISDASIPTPILEVPIAKCISATVIEVTRLDRPPAVNA